MDPAEYGGEWYMNRAPWNQPRKETEMTMPAPMKKTFTRTITVEFTLSDPGEAGATEFDGLATMTNDEVIATEKRMLLSEWFGNTEYALIDDVITEKG